MSHDEVMELPLKTFWFLSHQVDRIRAEDMLDWMSPMSIGMGGEHVPRVAKKLKERVGNPMIMEATKLTRSAKEKLRAFFGGG